MGGSKKKIQKKKSNFGNSFKLNNLLQKYFNSHKTFYFFKALKCLYFEITNEILVKNNRIGMFNII